MRPYTFHNNISTIVNCSSSDLVFVGLTGDGDIGGVTIYDGVNNKGDRKFRFMVPSGESIAVSLPKSVNFKRGIYIEVDNANSYYSIIFQSPDMV